MRKEELFCKTDSLDLKKLWHQAELGFCLVLYGLTGLSLPTRRNVALPHETSPEFRRRDFKKLDRG